MQCRCSKVGNSGLLCCDLLQDGSSFIQWNAEPEHLQSERMANTAKGKVCVTGASGFVASWLVKRLLEFGYHVLGTVRDPGNHKKVAHLWDLAGAKERLELVRADLLEEGSFDDAVMACEGVFHTASPIVTKSDSKEEMLNAAINGTLNVLRSCKKNPSLKRVVLTSSSSTVRIKDEADLPPNVSLDETSWSSIEFCESLQIWYAVAKILAEKAAWEFAKEHKIDLVTVLPTFVVGPNLSPELGPTASDVLGLFQGVTEKFTVYGRMGYVHIDDVASCHILVYETAGALGRYICNSAVLDNNDLVALLAKRFPSYPIPKSLPNIYGEQSYHYSTSKARELGLEFKGVEEMFDDAVDSLRGHGYLPEKSGSMLRGYNVGMI
ncbi:tetraketide alpha-pyrone reductase 1-like [Phragmites australis]|uniref:tetraketide alpha-pyrone reductase 1-like n=1 Tax=Phragmites australis TaxID=29695 RepID=UPI002D7688E1|nr:tetraketide alpha-pyrone reductase 1-like [Phragmites australis]